MAPPDSLPRYEQELRAFLAPLGVDLDAQAVCFQLYRTATDVIAAFEAKALRSHGLSHTGFALMMTIQVGGPQEVRVLARKHRLSKPSVTSAIGTLERAGLVERQRSTDDRRLVSVRLTAQGRRVVRKALDALHRCEREFTAALTRGEQRQLAASLRRVGDAARNGR
jgi:MarR family transcriptional regulator, 2-MHQ and catechol-resistance regulon repressor